MVHELGGTVWAEAGSVSRGQGLSGLGGDRLLLVRQVHLRHSHIQQFYLMVDPSSVDPSARAPFKLESRPKQIADGDCARADSQVVEFNIVVADIIVRSRPDEAWDHDVVTLSRP